MACLHAKRNSAVWLFAMAPSKVWSLHKTRGDSVIPAPGPPKEIELPTLPLSRTEYAFEAITLANEAGRLGFARGERSGGRARAGGQRDGCGRRHGLG